MQILSITKSTKESFNLTFSILHTVILFHPDYNRRLWRLTKSADLDDRKSIDLLSSSARGLIKKDIPPVGNFTPP